MKSLLNNKKRTFTQQIIYKIAKLIYKKFSVMPGINLVDTEIRASFKLEGCNPFKAARLLKSKVLELIEQTGIDKIKFISIWELDYYDLSKAIDLLQYGIAKQEDFAGSPVSKVTEWDKDILPWNKNTLDYEVDNDPELKEIARSNSKDQKEYIHLHNKFTNYRYDVLRNQRATKKISQCTEKFGFTKYMGASLYDITDRSIYYEALDAIGLMCALKHAYSITHYKGIPIEDLNKFTLEKIWDFNEEERISECTINKPAEPIAAPTTEDPEAAAANEKKALQSLIKKIVRAELKKAQQDLSVKKTAAGIEAKKSTLNPQPKTVKKTTKGRGKTSKL